MTALTDPKTEKPKSRPAAGSVRPNADFEPSRYRASIADMFGLLDRKAQTELAEKLAILPRHIHKMATEGLIAAPALARVNTRKPPRRLG